MKCLSYSYKYFFRRLRAESQIPERLCTCCPLGNSWYFGLSVICSRYLHIVCKMQQRFAFLFPWLHSMQSKSQVWEFARGMSLKYNVCSESSNGCFCFFFYHSTLFKYVQIFSDYLSSVLLNLLHAVFTLNSKEKEQKWLFEITLIISLYIENKTNLLNL